MKATTLVKKLNKLIKANGDFKVEVETPMAIYKATKVYFAETDSPRGPTIIVESDGSFLRQ